MTKKEAIALMLEGVWMTHPNLRLDDTGIGGMTDSITYRGADVLFSTSKPCKIKAFWKKRQDVSWNVDWSKA